VRRGFSIQAGTSLEYRDRPIESGDDSELLFDILNPAEIA
jgi:hypothetical protein